MDISKIEKLSLSSNIYDDLRGIDSLSRSKIPYRSTSTISYINPHQIENSQTKRPTVSLTMPISTTISSKKSITTSDTILSIDDTKQSSSVQLNDEQENKDLLINKNHSLVYEEENQSFICCIVRGIIQLIYIALFACLIAVLAFTLIFYAFDTYWFEQPIVNSSLWWWLDNNDTNFTVYDYGINAITQTINYDDEY